MAFFRFFQTNNMEMKMLSQCYNSIDFIPQLRLMAGFASYQDVAEYFEVHPNTWRKWEQSGNLKRHVREALKIKAGYLPYKEWHSFRFTKGKLWTPANYPLSPGVIESLPLLIECARHTTGYDNFISAREQEMSA